MWVRRENRPPQASLQDRVLHRGALFPIRVAMSALRDALGSGDNRRKVIDDACRVLDLEVSDKGGLTGLAIKGAYKLVQGVKPGFIREAVDHLLDDFLDALDPVYQEARQKGEPPGPYLRRSSSRVADALLSVTDRKAEKAQRPVIKKTYDKLRPTAKKHVEDAAPRLSEMLERHAPA
jgi:hypothetical protein